jgi:hypothetical protein
MKPKNSKKKPSFNKKSFSLLWKGMTEQRRRNNIGNFVGLFDREPTETEIKTGEIKQ